jgi:hypothetical protein
MMLMSIAVGVFRRSTVCCTDVLLDTLSTRPDGVHLVISLCSCCINALNDDKARCGLLRYRVLDILSTNAV